MTPRIAAACLALALTGCGGSAGIARAPKLPPANPAAVAKMMQGVSAAKQPGGRSRAVGLLRQAVAKDPKLWEARYDLGVLLARSGNLAESEHQLEQAAELATNAEDVAVALGEVRRRRGEPGASADGLAAFVAGHPKALTAKTALVSALRESGRIDLAIQHAHEVLVHRSNDPNALAELALSHLARREIDTAKLLSAQALEVGGKNAVAERTAGLIALAQGDDALAFRHFARASELDPQDTTASLNVGTVLLRAGVYDRAVEEFRRVLTLKSTDIDAKIGLAAALRGRGSRQKQGTWLEAERLLKEVLDVQPKNLAANLNLGLLYADFMQNTAAAKPYLRRFLKVSPASHPARAGVEKRLAASR